jgi:hypothetical protein
MSPRPPRLWARARAVAVAAALVMLILLAISVSEVQALPENVGGGQAPQGAGQPAAAESIVSWSIVEPQAQTGLEPLALFDRASLAIPDLDPAAIMWLAVSNADRLLDLPTGDSGNIPAVPGQPVLNQPNMDDYIVVSVTGPSGEAPSTVIDRNDAYGAALGTQSVLVGTFPRVRVVSHINWDQTPPVTTSELRPESGEFTDWFAKQGKGTYTFSFEFWNEFTDRGSHPALWLVAGTLEPAAPAGGGTTGGGGGGPADELASAVADEGATTPTPQDGIVGGVAATGVLLMAIAGSLALASPALGGPETAGSRSLPTEPPPLTPVEREMAAVERRIGLMDDAYARLVKSALRINAATNSGELGAGDAAEILGDLSSAIATFPPAAVPAGLASMVFSSLSAASSLSGERESLDALRENLAGLTYLQGRATVDREALGQQLMDLRQQQAAERAGVRPPPPVDPSAMTRQQLEQARTRAEADVSLAYSRAAATQDELSRFVEERNAVQRRMDALRTGREEAQVPVGATSPSVSMPVLSADTGGESLLAHVDAAAAESGVVSAAREGMQASRRAAEAAALERAAAFAEAQRAAEFVERGSGLVSAGAGVLSAAAWGNDLAVDAANARAHQAVAQLAYRHGELAARADQAQSRLEQMRQQCDQAVTTRRTLSTEIERRDVESGHVLWR